MWWNEPRRLLTAVFFLLACFFATSSLFEVVTYFVPAVGFLLLLVILLLPFSVLVLAGILIANGFRMTKREGRSLGNSLSLLVGIALVLVPVAAVVLVFNVNPVTWTLASLAFCASAQLGVSFLVFFTFWKLYERHEPRPDPRAVVVLGSGLVRGKVPPLLRARLDRGIAMFERVTGAGFPTLLIPSGGQGADEPRSEGEAMREYLLEQGVDPNSVIAETRSRNTEQNLRFSIEIVDRHAREIDRETGVVIADAAPASAQQVTFDPARETPGGILHGSHSATGGGDVANASGEQIMVVTNGYHVPRAALLARSLDIDADVVGAPTARYFVPSAFIREFVGLVRMHLRLNIGLAIPGVLLSLLVGGLLLWVQLAS